MKMTGMLVVSLGGVNCRFSLRAFGMESLPYLPIQVFMLGLILSCVGPTMLGVETLESRGPVKSINWFFLKNERSKDYCKADQNNVYCFFTIHVVLISFAVVFGRLVFGS